jgi:hypothetical protein
VVEWSRALDVRLSEWCCSVSMVWVQILSREEQKFDGSKNLILTLFGLIFRRIYIYIYKDHRGSSLNIRNGQTLST